MNDQISLTIPARARYAGVATLVLGGIGSRLDLSYERMDDLQLAVLSVLESGAEQEITVEVEAEAERLRVSSGPARGGKRLGSGPGSRSRPAGRLVRERAARRP